MSTFSSHSELKANFDQGDVYTVSVSSGYRPDVTINTRSNDSVVLSFSDVQELKQFIESIMTVAVAMRWNEQYASANTYPKDERVTVDQVLEWKRAAEQQRKDASDLQALRDKLTSND